MTRIVQVGCDLGLPGAVQAAPTTRTGRRGRAASQRGAADPRRARGGALAAAARDRGAGCRAQVRGIGETGLDYYRTEPAGRAVQEESFRDHIRTRQGGRQGAGDPRSRRASPTSCGCSTTRVPRAGWLHCFSGDADFARRCARGWSVVRRRDHVQERPVCARRSRSFLATGSWSRPTRRSWPPRRTAANPTART